MESFALVSAALFASVASATPLDDRASARKLFDSSDWPGAIARYEKLIASNPDFGSDHFFLAGALLGEGRCGEAIPQFERAISLGVDGSRRGLIRAHVDLARCAVRLGELDLAFRHIAIASQQYGFDGFADLAKEPGFADLSKDPRFKRLAAQPLPELSRAAAWRSDLAYFVDLVQRRHPNPFHATSKTDWLAAVARLQREIPGMTDLQVVGGFMHLASMIGDGHTAVFPPLEGPGAYHLLPIWPYRLGSDWFVLGASPVHRDLVGSRIVAIAGVPISMFEQRMRLLVPADNETTIGFVGNTALQFFELDELAAGAKAKGTLSIEVVDRSGTRRSVALEPGPLDRDPTAAWVPGEWQSISPPEVPLWLAHVDDTFHVSMLDGGATLYAQVNHIADGRDETFAQFSEALGKSLRQPGVRRLIIDLRHNNGGSGSLNWLLVRELVRAPALEPRGALFVITGPRTFSAAMNLASMIETDTNAIFVGEPTGSRPNFYGEDTDFVLPNSRLTGSISSAWFQGGTTSDDLRPFIAPDLPAPLTIDDLSNGRDPALEAIEQYIAEHAGGAPSYSPSPRS